MSPSLRRWPHWDGSDRDSSGSAQICTQGNRCRSASAAAAAYTPEQLTGLIHAYEVGMCRSALRNRARAAAEAVALKDSSTREQGELEPTTGCVTTVRPSPSRWRPRLIELRPRHAESCPTPDLGNLERRPHSPDPPNTIATTGAQNPRRKPKPGPPTATPGPP